MKRNCLKASYRASAAIDPNNSKILSDTSLGKVSSEGSKQQMAAEYLGARLLGSEFVALKAVCYVK